MLINHSLLPLAASDKFRSGGPSISQLCSSSER
jgi:hypothetical protein